MKRRRCMRREYEWTTRMFSCRCRNSVDYFLFLSASSRDETEPPNNLVLIAFECFALATIRMWLNVDADDVRAGFVSKELEEILFVDKRRKAGRHIRSDRPQESHWNWLRFWRQSQNKSLKRQRRNSQLTVSHIVVLLCVYLTPLSVDESECTATK